MNKVLCLKFLYQNARCNSPASRRFDLRIKYLLGEDSPTPFYQHYLLQCVTASYATAATPLEYLKPNVFSMFLPYTCTCIYLNWF